MNSRTISSSHGSRLAGTTSRHKTPVIPAAGRPRPPSARRPFIVDRRLKLRRNGGVAAMASFCPGLKRQAAAGHLLRGMPAAFFPAAPTAVSSAPPLSFALSRLPAGIVFAPSLSGKPLTGTPCVCLVWGICHVLSSRRAGNAPWSSSQDHGDDSNVGRCFFQSWLPQSHVLCLTRRFAGCAGCRSGGAGHEPGRPFGLACWRHSASDEPAGEELKGGILFHGSRRRLPAAHSSDRDRAARPGGDRRLGVDRRKLAARRLGRERGASGQAVRRLRPRHNGRRVSGLGRLAEGGARQ